MNTVTHETPSNQSVGIRFDGTGSAPTILIIVAVIATVGYLNNVIDVDAIKHLAELRGIGATMPLLGAILGFV
ncbi:hypothetical protein [Acidihalobacter aeolianus]|uniref:hypothetical protein n=1 Tax=Acidihalobacter aeolianus TaxID=2792603 RepID=UPI0012E9ABBD|nr:hypothetical protein [Acidihalobacter aeolianus]